ncbi:kelch repeat-containing protein [Sorangium sp. So ce134]
MSPCSFLRRVLPRSSSLLWAGACFSACSAEVEPPASAAALRRQFPDQSAAVLEAREAFIGDGEGFHLGWAEVRGRPSRPHVVLPREGSEPIRFRTPAGVEVRVRELGAAGEGTPVGQAVAYRRSGGTSFWSATDHGVEEWLLLDEGVARGEVVVAWAVEGATLRERGEAVELVEAGRGAAMLRVSAPRAYASSGRPVAMALRARGSRIELSVDMGDAGGEAVLVDPEWVLTAGAMNAARSEHSATLLPSGKVLVAGGLDVENQRFLSLESAELYDPATDSWSPTGDMTHARGGHTATLLSNGEVLVVGGEQRVDQVEVTVLATAERYDPETGAWTDAAPMHIERYGHTATLLSTGKVLVAGGAIFTDSPVSAELYDPEVDRWTSIAPMKHERFRHGATLLSSGKVLVAGGTDSSSPLASAELYDPGADRWELAHPMNHARMNATMTLLSNGEVLAAGGRQDAAIALASAERYDPKADRWTLTRPMTAERLDHTATLLPDGLVLLAGGHNLASSSIDYMAEVHGSAERYDPAVDTWTPTNPMSSARSGHSATRLSNGEVLVAGGWSGTSRPAESERLGLVRGEACTAASACFSTDVCVDGICCDAPCPCGTCSAPGAEGRCSESGIPAKVGSICAPSRCDGDLDSFEPARCTLESSACPAQVSVGCVAYRCDPQSGACKQSCASNDDCAPRFVCNLRGHCVSPPPEPGAAAGCRAGPGGAAAGAACSAVVLLVALGAARRRRRRAAGAFSLPRRTSGRLRRGGRRAEAAGRP